MYKENDRNSGVLNKCFFRKACWERRRERPGKRRRDQETIGIGNWKREGHGYR